MATTLRGGTCTRSNAFSGPVLIARGLDLEHAKPLWRFEGAHTLRPSLDNFGCHTGRKTPLPIPNREVKPARADGTRRATSRESRSPPIICRKEAAQAAFFHAATSLLARARDVGARPRSRRTRSASGGCVTNNAQRPCSANGVIVN